MTLRRVFWLLVSAGGLTACSQSSQLTTTVAEWALGSAPLVVLADSSNPGGHEFNGISSARVLANHDILIANAGSVELSLYDSTGTFQRTVGRKGNGPGEFQGPISVFAWRGDSVVVYDPAVLRWTILDPTLSTQRTAQAPDSTILQPTWLYKGIIVTDGVTDSVSTWVLSVLDSARALDPQYTQLIHAWRDDAGGVWVQSPTNPRRWLVYAKAGTAVGAVTLPAGFQPLQIGERFVLGLLQDSLGIEDVRLYSLERPSSFSIRSTGPFVRVPSAQVVVQQFRDFITAQEVYYSSHGKYAPSTDSLALQTSLTGKFFVLGGDARHWAGISVQPETGATCGVSVGWPAPLGWMDGTPFCGR